MNCSKCGNQLTDTDSPFCPFCGTPQGADAASTDGADSAQDQAGGSTTADTTASGDAGQSEEPALHPLTEKAMAGQTVDTAAGGAGQVPPVSPVVNPMNPPMGTNPFESGQMPQKKRMPAWAIALIAVGVALVLAFCCCIAIVVFSDDFMEGFEQGLEAGRQSEVRPADPVVPEFLLDEDLDFDFDDIFADEPVAGDAATIQGWIDENQALLEEVSGPALAMMGDGASIDFLAADGELIFIYTFGSGLPAGLLTDTLAATLEQDSDTYALFAGILAMDMGLDELTLTVRYYQNGDYLTSESFQSR